MNHKKVLADETLTFSEKLLTLRRIDYPNRIAFEGEEVQIEPDLTLATDGSAPITFKLLKKMNVSKLWDPKRILVVIDHTYPASSELTAALHDEIRDFCKTFGCIVEEGSISHQLILEEYATPGMIIIGADSHTPTAGCLGAFSTWITPQDMASLFASGVISMKVPNAVKISIKGRFPRGVYSKDLALNLLNLFGHDGLRSMVLEYHGDALTPLSIDSRAVLANMAVEFGAYTAVIEYDKVTTNFLQYMNRSIVLEAHSGRYAEYSKEYVLEVDDLEPLLVLPDSISVKPVEDVIGVHIDQAFLGACTNGRLEDIELAAKMIKGRSVKNGTRLIVTPASRRVYHEALQRGFAEALTEAGAVVTSPTCGACVGSHCGVLGANEICISTGSRNYSGRMGSEKSRVYLASPATVVASAIKGAIADPRRLL